MAHRFLFIIPLIIISGLILSTVSRGLADIHVKPAQRSLKIWDKDIKSLDITGWTLAYDSVSKAIEQDPHNPELLTLLANIQEWNIYLDQNDAENNPYLSLALENYRRAATLRPSWPYAWTQISLVKYRMGEIDREFIQAMETAINTGPWEPGIHQIITELGLNVWTSLNSEMRTKVIRNINRGITMQPASMLEILRKYGQLNMVCHQRKKTPGVTEYCEKYNNPKLLKKRLTSL